MSKEIKIAISYPPTVDLVHRFRNLGEDIYHALRDRCAVDLDEIDSATTAFTVRCIHNRDLKRVTRIIEKLLENHNFSNTAELTCIHKPGWNKA